MGFRYAKESTYLTSPLSEWNEVAGMSYVEVKMWQVSYQQRLSEEMRSVVDDINAYFGEDFNRFMGEYSELFGEYMAGVSKADIPFWKKKLFLGEELAFLSLSSIFDLIMGVAGIFTGGATIAIISAVKGVTEAIGSKAYYGQDMSDGDFLMQIGMAGVSYGMSYLPGAGDLVKGASMGVQVGVTVGMAAAKTTISTGADFLMRGMFKNDWSLDGEAFARDLGIGSVTAAAMMGMSGIERQTGSSFLETLANMAVRGGITALGNTIYGEATGRRVSGFMETTGISMGDFGGLMGSGIIDIKRIAQSAHYREAGYSLQAGIKMVMIDEEKAALESMKDGKSEDEIKRIDALIKELELEKLKITLEKKAQDRNSAAAGAMALILSGAGVRRGKEEEWEEKEFEEDELNKLIRELPQFLLASNEVPREVVNQIIKEQRYVYSMLKEMMEVGYLKWEQVKNILIGKDVNIVGKIQEKHTDFKEITEDIHEKIRSLSKEEKNILVALRTELGDIGVDEAMALFDYIDSMKELLSKKNPGTTEEDVVNMYFLSYMKDYKDDHPYNTNLNQKKDDLNKYINGDKIDSKTRNSIENIYIAMQKRKQPDYKPSLVASDFDKKYRGGFTTHKFNKETGEYKIQFKPESDWVWEKNVTRNKKEYIVQGRNEFELIKSIDRLAFFKEFYKKREIEKK